MAVETRTSDIFYKIAQLAVASGDEPDRQELFLARLLEQFTTADAASIWFYFPDQSALIFGAARGYREPPPDRIELPFGANAERSRLTGQAILKTAPSDAATRDNEMSFPQRALYQAAGVEHPHSAIGAPLRVGETRLGVVVVENLTRAAQFTADDLKWLQVAANFLALSMSHARVKQSLREAQTVIETSGVTRESIAFLAHEMRTPLTSIKGSATALMMEDVEFEPAAQREFLESIDRECDSLIGLIQDLLESSVLDAGILEIEIQPVRVPRIVQGVIDEIRHTTLRHRFVVEFSGEIPPVPADPVRLAQVVRNLLENAVKYSPQGGLIVVHGETQPEHIVVSIADQGIGIAPEHLNRLFEKFFRVKTGAAQGTVGSGLGLPIARSIVEAHGGQIWAESQLGQGTIFYFTLPLEQPHILSERSRQIDNE